jgi:hypothetical protein
MQNRSHAVMAQRHEAPDSLDDFPTPPWATRALLEHVLIPRGLVTPHQSCWEPACNRGYMAEPLRPYFRRVYATDIHHYGYDSLHAVQDFLGRDPAPDTVDWIITNPPFRLAMEFALRALDLAQLGVAILVRGSWIEGGERYARLFSKHPPTIVAPFVERVAMVRGRLDLRASTATAYSWFVWFKVVDYQRSEPIVVWIPDGQARALTKPDDIERFCTPAAIPLLGELA